MNSVEIGWIIFLSNHQINKRNNNKIYKIKYIKKNNLNFNNKSIYNINKF